MFNPLYCGCGDIPPFPQFPRTAPSGWNNGSGCGCSPCVNPGPCPIQLDFNCIIYHKDNSQINNLAPLGLNNGATLQLFADTISALLAPIINTPDWVLPCLRTDYTINTLQQFGQSVDTQLCILQSEIDALTASSLIPITPVDTNSINLTVSGTLNHTLQADAKISATANNNLSILSDGLFVTPQSLIADFINKTLTITQGNTIDLTSMICGVGGFLGNVTADPSVVEDGQYWFRTDLSAASGLKIRLNGATRTITTS